VLPKAALSECLHRLLAISIRLLIAIAVVMTVTAVATMHEQMHEGTRQDHEEWQSGKDMLLVPDHKVAADKDCDCQKN
jgi:hypothetical protein